MSLHILEHGVPVAAAPPASFDYGFNIRLTDAGVTDGPNEAWLGGFAAFNYPSQILNDEFADDVQCGWTFQNGSYADEFSNATDRRLKGHNARNNGSAAAQMNFRIDFANGTDVLLSAAMGRFSTARSRVQIFDSTGLRFDIENAAQTNRWLGCDGVVYEEADWLTAYDFDGPGGGKLLITNVQGYLELRHAQHSSGSNSTRFAHFRFEGA